MKIEKNKIRKIVSEALTEYFVENNKPTYNNPLTLYPFYVLNETLLHSVSVEKVKEYIKDYFKLNDDNFHISNVKNVSVLNVYVYLTQINVEMLEKAMNYLGWFLSYPKINYILQMKEMYKNGKIDNVYLTLQFEPKHQNNITDIIKKQEKTLIHITPSYYIGKIKKIGFSPRTKNKKFDYPNRVYFLRGSVDDNEILKFAEILNYNNENPTNYGKYAVITIDVNKLSDTIELFYDPNFDVGVYTCDNIPPNVISNIREIQLKDWTV